MVCPTFTALGAEAEGDASEGRTGTAVGHPSGGQTQV